MGCYELLSASCHPSSPLLLSPPHTAHLSHRWGHVIRISWRRETPLPTHTPQQDYTQILATSPKIEDGLHLGVCECSS
jgi:hypothetical protein